MKHFVVKNKNKKVVIENVKLWLHQQEISALDFLPFLRSLTISKCQFQQSHWPVNEYEAFFNLANLGNLTYLKITENSLENINHNPNELGNELAIVSVDFLRLEWSTCRLKHLELDHYFFRSPFYSVFLSPTFCGKELAILCWFSRAVGPIPLRSCKYYGMPRWGRKTALRNRDGFRIKTLTKNPTFKFCHPEFRGI